VDRSPLLALPANHAGEDKSEGDPAGGSGGRGAEDGAAAGGEAVEEAWDRVGAIKSFAVFEYEEQRCEKMKV